jgi:hypothetical protein
MKLFWSMKKDTLIGGGTEKYLVSLNSPEIHRNALNVKNN